MTKTYTKAKLVTANGDVIDFGDKKLKPKPPKPRKVKKPPREHKPRTMEKRSDAVKNWRPPPGYKPPGRTNIAMRVDTALLEQFDSVVKKWPGNVSRTWLVEYLMYQVVQQKGERAFVSELAPPPKVMPWAERDGA